MHHSIIEFKARCSNHSHIRDVLESKHARYLGADHQIDTYFRVPHGRLKLREGDIENSLVFYSRPNQSGPKQSEVTVTLVPAQTELRAVLSNALGELIVVDKKREIYFVDNVKIHLDEVASLGTFLEVEAIGDAENISALQRQCDHFKKEFAVSDADLIAVSYSDLLLNSPQKLR